MFLHLFPSRLFIYKHQENPAYTPDTALVTDAHIINCRLQAGIDQKRHLGVQIKRFLKVAKAVGRYVVIRAYKILAFIS